MVGSSGQGKSAQPWRVGIVVIWGAFSLLAAAVASPRHLGEDFLVAFMQNGLQQTLNSDFKLLLTGYSPFTSITISMKKPGLRMTVQATTGQTILVKIPPQAEMVGSKSFQNAVVVRATDSISLVMVNEKPTSVDSTVVYPVHAWGTQYHVVTPNVGTERYGQFAVAAWDEATAVEVHLKASVTYRGRSYPRGTVLSVDLEPFQAAQLQSSSDLSGTMILARKPVAVFTGHTCSARFAQCDHLVEQLRPVSSWGTNFIVPPLPFEAQSDIVYVVTSRATRVESQQGATKSLRELRPNRSTLYGLQASNTLTLVANVGVQVMFFADGGTKDSVSYDPFFMSIPDVSSYCHSYNVFTLDGYENYVLLVAKTSGTSQMMLDKAPLRNVVWKPIPGTDYAWASLSLGGQFGVHSLEHEASPFGLLSLGIREQKAFGSAAVCHSDPCRLVKCRPKETCKMEKGEAKCAHDYMGTCMGSQALQYHTFDAVTVDVRGGCTYTLAKLCGGDPTLVPFTVEEEKKSEGGPGGSLTKIYVYSHNISIHQGEGGTIQVNGQATSLPATLAEGKIQISHQEGRPTLQTDFGLQVTYDEDWAIMVAVPSSYFGATCGLCGNFNEDPEDEATLSDGTPAASLEDWVESWRDASCQEQCGDQETLQDTGGCAPRCANNSHFEACGPACPPTCSDPSSSCDQPCRAGCQCDRGFLLRGSSCVPAETCGCHHNGRPYLAQQEFWEDGSCRRRCRCQAGGQVVCREAECKGHEKCVVVGDVPGCQAAKYLTCIGTGDPHYTTFDGLRYDFQGTCVYQLAALCSRDPGLVPFAVKVENNNRGSKAVSFTKTVTLEVYGRVITMSQEHPRKVKLDGAFVELPFSQKGRFELYHSGVHGFARTAFGLRVSFDWHSYARVILPDSYAGAVCGLCGDADGDPDNDFVTRGGRRAGDEIQLADSWKVAEVPGCSAGCADCPTCDEEKKRPYRGDGYCGVIARAGGPFRACHPVVDPLPFLEDCAFDACHHKGHRDTVCKAVAAYVTECQSRGVAVESWRTTAFCRPSCPRHSHYELCGPSCPATCRDSLHPEGCSSSSSSCTEGCFCDGGFLLSGDQCVPPAECGCVHRDRYYRRGQEFQPSCQQRCRCGAGGQVECREAFCRAHEECRVENGALGCHPAGYGRLVVSGDPHYVTFDGRTFDVPGSCSYVLAKLCGAASGSVNFSVLLEHGEGGRGHPALVKKVVTSVHGHVVAMERGRPWEVTVDGERRTLPLATEDQHLRLSQEGTNVVLQSTAGLRLLYNAATYLLLTIPDGYRGHVCGLGGNYNGDPDDDFQLPGGSLAENTQEFVSSWKVPAGDEGCSDDCAADGSCPTCDASAAVPYAADDSCGLIRDPEGPFGSCHLLVSPVEYFDHCLHDVCVAEGARRVLCHSLQAYATACQAAGARIGGWRTESFCPLSCPPNSHYELCTRTCDFTCASLSVPTPCSWTCFEGCQCDDGFLFDGEACVSLEKCGCVHRGRYFKAGETLMSNNCSTSCSCHPSQGLLCEDTRCPPGQVCGTRDGAQSCLPGEGRCHISPGASLTTFDGLSGKLLASGTYKVAALCDEQSPNWFKVVVEVSECREDQVPAAVAAFVFFREAFITINANMEVWVNGLFTPLPALVAKSISLSSVGGNVSVSHPSGMEVLFSPGGEVTVTAGATLANLLCAPCGNFNGDPGDDLRLPNNNQPVGSVGEVVDAWKARDFVGCD